MRVVTIAVLVIASGALGGAEQRRVRGDLLIAAAASLSGLAPELTQAFHDASGVDVRFNFAGSNTLARQIVEGARVDVFISADEAQMDLVEKAGRLVAGTRMDVVGNQLVVIRAAAPSAPLLTPDDLAAPAIRRVAMGDPGAVPAGVYGRHWLENMRLWSSVQGKVVPLPSSPAAVAAVAEGRADAGIVYASDVAQRPGVQVAYRVPLEDAPRIVYPAAVVTGARIPLAQQFIAFVRSDAARRVFERAGFRPLR